MKGIVVKDIKFGWLSPVAGHAGSGFQPIVMYQEEHIFPHVLPHFDSVWIADHFYGFDDAKQEGFLEGWTTLTWLAARFPDVMLCHHVLGCGYRNPALLAKMASTLQVLSGGRFMLGIGAGWREDEYKAYGYEFPKASVRFRQLEETVQICRLMWTEEHPTFRGEYFEIDDAAATPRPEVTPRICIGAAGEKVGLPLVGRRADLWNTSFSDDESWTRKRDIVFSSAVEAGRETADVEITVTSGGDLPESDADSDRWVERLTHLRDLGATHLVMDFGHPLNAEPALRFAEQVIAPMRAS
jgi:alkanesulfonate monooxygenase SsuD/methylene tetrahydromethanopterin reductase-like flavin-dependent oxidoreductase (luciferase family)